jgi:hypothetical protein
MIAAFVLYGVAMVFAFLLQARPDSTGGGSSPNDFVRIATTYFQLYVVPGIVWLVRRISVLSGTKKYGYLWSFVLAIPTTFFNLDTGLFSMERLTLWLGTGFSAMGVYHLWKNYKAAQGKPLA